MRVRVTAPGIFGVTGELPIGTEFDVKGDLEPSIAARVTVIKDEPGPDAVLVTGLDRDDLKKQADELGIEYARNIPTEKLKELIDARLAE